MASKKRKCEQRDDLPSASYPRGGLFGSTRRHRLDPYPLDSTVAAEVEAAAAPVSPPQEVPSQEGAEVRHPPPAAPVSPPQEVPSQEGAEVRRLVVPLSRESLICLLCSAAASNPSILQEIRRANRRALSHPAPGSASSHRHRHRRDQKLEPNPNPDPNPHPRNPGVRINGNGETLYNTEARAPFKEKGNRNLQNRRPPNGSASRDSQQ